MHVANLPTFARAFISPFMVLGFLCPFCLYMCLWVEVVLFLHNTCTGVVPQMEEHVSIAKATGDIYLCVGTYRLFIFSLLFVRVCWLIPL